MMTRNDPAKPVQAHIFKVMLRDIVFSGHELVLLKNAIDWKRFETMLEPAYSDDGRPSCAVRTLAGLTFLKFMFGLSDQEVLDNWCENPYWQDFCGGVFFEHEPPTDQSTMSRWRKKLEKSGGEEMLKETVEVALRNKVAKKSDFTRVNVDTTVQEKNIRFPTDARTLDRARERVVATSKTNWILGAQAFPGNPYDGNTMAMALEQSERISGVKPEHAFLCLVPETPNGMSTLLVDMMESLCLRMTARRCPGSLCLALRTVA